MYVIIRFGTVFSVSHRAAKGNKKFLNFMKTLRLPL